MANASKEPGSRPIAWLAAVALALELVSWSWAAGHAGPGAPGVAVGLGLLGVVLGSAAGWLLLRKLQYARLEISRTRKAAASAIEHEQAMELVRRDAEKASELLVTALDALPIGIAIFDADDRLVIKNQYLGDMFPGLTASGHSAETFESMLRNEMTMGLLPEAAGKEEEWLAQRMAARGISTQPILQKLTGDRWIHTYEVRTRHGFSVVARAEVTDLVRKEQLLAQANEQLSRQTATDGLTGIANRRRFDETLINEWLRAARSGASLSLLMVDIDHFKRYNDHYGHVAGDECLRRVTKVLARCVRRAGELLARYGGEEFVMLLPGADLEQAREMAQRCLNHIRDEAIPHGSSPTGQQITFSIGIAQVVPTANRDPEALVNAADTAMYRAKMAGRARFAVADVADWEIDKNAPRSRVGDLV